MERFLNICAHRKILLTDVRHKGSAYLTAVVSIGGFRQIRGAAYKTKTKVKILRKKGLPFLFARLLHRQALILGFVLFGMIIFFLTTRVWVIDVQGNVNVTTVDILKQLELCGLKNGTPIWTVNPDKMQTSALARMPELSWLWVTVEGTRAIVEVKERVQKPEMVPTNVPCNIIATKDGIIKRLVVKNGVSAVKENMAVAQGQLLVSGIVESKVIPARYVRAEAEIWARTTYDLKKTYSLINIKRIETGGLTVRHKVDILGREFNLFLGEECPYQSYQSMLSQSRLKVFNNLYLPVIIKTAEYKQVKEVEEKMSAEEVIAKGKADLEEMLRSQTIGNIEEKKFESVNIDENNISVSLIAHCVEQIAKQVNIVK